MAAPELFSVLFLGKSYPISDLHFTRTDATHWLLGAARLPPPPATASQKLETTTDFAIIFNSMQAAIDDGKKHATNLTNAILTLG